jgi:hypothetical protein
VDDEQATDGVATCVACGATLEPAARFCTSCGRDTTTADTTTADTPMAGPAAAAPATTVLPSMAPRRPGPDGTRCPSCGAPNPDERELCHRCGVDLVSGDRLPSLDDPDRPQPSSAPPIVRSRVWLWLVPLLAIVGVVGAVVLGLWLAGIGPFAQPERLDPVDFPAASYPGEPGLLPLASVAAVTTRAPDGGRTFTPEHLVDGDPTTSWHGDPDALPPGVTEKVDVFLEDPAWVSAVVVGNGDHLDANAYEAAARVQRAVLLFDGDVAYDAVLLDLGLQPQVVELPEPALTTSVRIEVVDTVGGRGGAAAAISRIDLRGWPADEADGQLAEQRADVRPAAGSITLSTAP